MAGLNQQPEFASRYDHFNPGLKGRNRSNTGTANITMPHNDRPCHGEARELWRGGGGGGEIGARKPLYRRLVAYSTCVSDLCKQWLRRLAA